MAFTGGLYEPREAGKGKVAQLSRHWSSLVADGEPPAYLCSICMPTTIL